MRDVIAAGERGDGPQVIAYWGELTAERGRGPRAAAAARGPRPGRRPQRGRVARLAHRCAAGAVRRRGPPRQRLPVAGAGPRPRRGLHPGRRPGGLPRHRRRRGGPGHRGDAAARPTWWAQDRFRGPGTGSSTSRWSTPTASPALVRLGVVASVQPAFDAEWGGTDGMYAARLGASAGADAQPVRRHGRRGAVDGAGLRQPGHPVGAVGGGAGRASTTATPGSGSRPGRRSWPTPAAAGGPPASTTAATWTSGQPASFAIWSVGRPGRAGTRRPDPDVEHRPAVGHPRPARPVAGGRAADDAAHRRPGAHGVRARGGARPQPGPLRQPTEAVRRTPSGRERQTGWPDPRLTDARGPVCCARVGRHSTHPSGGHGVRISPGSQGGLRAQPPCASRSAARPSP